MQTEPQYRCVSETIKPQILLVHEPGEETKLAKEHPADWGFDPSLAEDTRSFEKWLKDAKREHTEFVSVLEQEGIKALYVTDLLQGKQAEVASYIQREFDRVKPKINQFDTELQHTIQEAYEEGMSSPVSFLLLGLESGKSFRQLPYPTRLYAYKQLKTLLPQTSLYYTQDPVISTPAGLVKAKLAMWLRRQEPDILELALGRENYVYRLRNGTEGGDVTMSSYAAGGDVLYSGGRMLIGISALSGKNIMQETERLSQVSAVVDTVSLFVPDYFEPSQSYATGNVMHLDTVLMPVDEQTLLANKRMLEETVVKERGKPIINGYEWVKRTFVNGLIEVPDEEQQGVYGWGSNVLPIGNRQILSSTHLKQTNRNLKQAGFTVYEVDSTTLTTGFGSFHCMTAYLG